MRSFLFFCCLLTFTSCGRCGWGGYYRHGIQQYTGDGVISDASQSSGGLGSRGYVVEFPKFDLGADYERQFKLAGLPTLGSAPAEIRLVVEDATLENQKNSLAAKIVIKLLESSGRQVAGYTAKLSDLIWSSPIHDHAGSALYELNHSEFVPRTDEIYTLSVSYIADTALQSKNGYIYVWCGCGGS